MHPLILELKKRSKFFEVTDFSNVLSKENIETRARGSVKKFKPANDLQGAAYFCIWGVLDDRRCVWMKGAFSKSINDRGPDSRANQKIFLSWWHNLTDPIGRPLKIVEDDLGAYVEYELDDPSSVPSAKRAQEQVINKGTVNGWSFGFNYLWDKMEVIEWEDKKDAVAIKEVNLIEISPLTAPSMTETFSVRSAKEFEEKKNELKTEAEYFLSSMPLTKQIELRQLLDKYDTLANFKPEGKPTLDLSIKPDQDIMVVGDYKLNLKQFKR